MLITLGLIIVAISICYIILKHRYYTDPDDGIPGLPPEFIFGHSRSTGLLTGTSICVIFSRLQQRYGDVFTFWWGHKRSIVLNRIEHVQYVLSNRQKYEQGSVTADGFSLVAPTGLISLQGQMWKRHARFILPMLKRAKIVHFIDKITQCTDEFIHNGELVDNQTNTNFARQFNELMLNIFAKVALGYDPTSDDKAYSEELSLALRDFIQQSALAMLAAGLPRILQHLFLGLNKKYQRARKIIHAHALAIIERESSHVKQMNERPSNLISSLMNAFEHDGLTKDEVFDEIILFLIGGTETLSSALSWSLYFISKRPSVQEQIKKELKENHVTADTQLTVELLDKLVYVDAVVKEVFRHAPILSAITRNVLQDDEFGKELESDGLPVIRVRAGDYITILMNNIHHDRRYWKLDPEQFLPERFLGEDREHHPYAFLPFGGGHRICAGHELAYFELKTIITRLMQFLTFIDCEENTGGYHQKVICFPKNLAAIVRFDKD